MKKIGNVYEEIKTSRLILRPFKETDAKAMYENWANDDEVTKYLSWPTHKSLEISQMVVKSFIEDYQNGSFNWAIVLKELNEPIGNISTVKNDIANKTCEIGYCLGRKYWNQGYVSEALEAVLTYLLSAGYQRIVAKHDVDNRASGKVMEKAGMKFVKFEKALTTNNQGLVDCNVYEILK